MSPDDTRSLPPAGAAAATLDDDPYRWLEEVDGVAALQWVRARNAETEAALTGPGSPFEALRSQLQAAYDAPGRIPGIVRRGGWLYNFWQDAEHPRGLWRRTTLDQYRRPDPAWELLLDVDALGAAEAESWVWAGATVLGPAYRRAMVSLSRGGADARVVREFDLETRSFVPGGFAVPEAKSDVRWIDDDTLYVATDVGPAALTDAGYPRRIRRWPRGTPLAEAPVVFEAEPGDVSAGVSVDRTPGYERTLFVRHIDFYTQHCWLLADDGSLQRLDVPDDASIHFHQDLLLMHLRSDWAGPGGPFPNGSLVYAPLAAYLAGDRTVQALFVPTATRSLADYDWTRGCLLLNVADNVASKLELWRRAEGGGFEGGPLDAPFPGTVGVSCLHDPLVPDDPLAEHYLLDYTDHLTPASLYLGHTGSARRELLKSNPVLFDAAGMRAEQHFATSRDGTRVPYFVVWPRDGRPDGDRPTLLYGYGGFEVSLEPGYLGGRGLAWLARGGVYVVANIRGGGEFGPAWHQAAVKAHKQRSYDDFAAVAEDLVARGITRPARLGIMGGSNGGLLVGAMAVQRPELFGAVVCQVPLLDMQRYHLLLAGASWIAEYGNPDVPEEWGWISAYSPYQRVRAEGRYPQVLFTTSTRDDRVHPGHARKMAAKMLAQGHAVRYFENIEGGHGGGADNVQRARMAALEFTFLWEALGAPPPSSP
jgi:prolyl oligopeptidase